ncbi:hypothetical protein TR2A62_3559 [Thalassobium sp. R2A62]|nr:hypothetical protein TR2A62_3559 [Thalassobium sp. R2A62]
MVVAVVATVLSSIERFLANKSHRFLCTLPKATYPQLSCAFGLS